MIVGPMLSTWIARFNIPDSLSADDVAKRRAHAGRCGRMCLWLSTSAVYSLVPNVKLPWYWFSPGSVFAVVGWILTSQGFRIYVENFANYNTTYGALGGVIVLMVWLNLTGAVLLMGGQINGVIHRAEVLQSANSKHDKTPPAVDKPAGACLPGVSESASVNWRDVVPQCAIRTAFSAAGALC